MGKTEMDIVDKEAYRRRLKLLRAFHDMNRQQWESFTGISYKKWYHYESGFPVSRESLFRLRSKITAFRLSGDWLYWGDTDALPPGLLRQFRALEKELEQRPKRLVPASNPLPSTPVEKVFRKRQRA